MPAASKAVVQGYKDTLAFAGMGNLATMSDEASDKNDSPEMEPEDMHEQPAAAVAAKQPVIAQKPVLAGEEEHLRAKLAGGRMVRILFQGDPPTRGEIDKVIALLELSKDQYPEA